MPTLLDGEALAVWLELDEDVQKDYKGAKQKIVDVLMPTEFVTLDKFHNRRYQPRRVPAEYRAEVEGLLKEMLQEGIIEESSSPWMAPAVYVKKKTGEIRLCVDYRALNKQTTKDAYPLPLPDEVQDRLCGCTIFSTLDLRLMDKVLRGLNFVTTYLDDVLVHSKTKDEHIKHLNVVFSRLKNAGLTLRGSKCHIGHDKVYYLGHVFSEQGMRPDEGKVRVVKEWPTPKNPSESFATIAASLHELTQKDVSFRWTSECDHAFNLLKEKLTQAPILVYPQFGSEATPFILETDASDVGIAAVLQQDGHVIAYASRALSKSEKNYSACHTERVLSNSLWHETVSTLSSGTIFHSSY
ncbi:hypothetical protein EMCRGX_G015661 [Ephydatia muelleri]